MSSLVFFLKINFILFAGFSNRKLLPFLQKIKKWDSYEKHTKLLYYFSDQYSNHHNFIQDFLIFCFYCLRLLSGLLDSSRHPYNARITYFCSKLIYCNGFILSTKLPFIILFTHVTPTMTCVKISLNRYHNNLLQMEFHIELLMVLLVYQYNLFL